MTDPLDALREPIRPVDPDPAFARRLRERIERAVLAPLNPLRSTPEDDMPTTTATRPPLDAAAAQALALHTVTPYLMVPDAAAALDFYADALGGVRRGDPITMPDGRIGHAEIALGDSVLMLAEPFPELGMVAPVPGAVTASLRLEVPDPDAVVARAVALGAHLDRAVSDSPYGRGGSIVDPSGHRWMISREAPAAPALRTGDVGYASLWTRDVVAAERFYGAVLGWTTAGDHTGQGRRVTGTAQNLGMFGGQERGTVFCCYAVADVDATVALVRAAGGTADEPTEEPYGRVADCTDDQGLRFAVVGLTPGTTAPDTTSPGALTYLTVEVPDTARARAFYGTVLGWRFAPGREPGMWHVRVDDGDAAPVTGLAGGREATVVPMFAVADIAAAVATVRSAGGTAEDPTQAGYGTSAACTDDQGARFWLVQY